MNGFDGLSDFVKCESEGNARERAGIVKTKPTDVCTRFRGIYFACILFLKQRDSSNIVL